MPAFAGMAGVIFAIPVKAGIQNSEKPFQIMAAKDIISKRLLKELLLQTSQHLFHVELLNVELLSTENQRVADREADLIAKVTPREGLPFILHIEIQSSNHPQMHIRMLRYLTDILLAHPQYDVRQYLLYIGARKFSMPTGLEKPLYTYEVTDFHYIDHHTFYDLNTPEAWVLAVISNSGAETQREVLFRVFDKLHHIIGEDEGRVRECLHMIETLTKDRGLDLNIQEAYNMLDVHVEELPSYQMGLDRGMERGIERGIERGVQVGERRRAIEVAQSLLSMNLQPEQVASIARLSVEEVKKLALGEGL